MEEKIKDEINNDKPVLNKQAPAADKVSSLKVLENPLMPEPDEHSKR